MLCLSPTFPSFDPLKKNPRRLSFAQRSAFHYFYLSATSIPPPSIPPHHHPPPPLPLLLHPHPHLPPLARNLPRVLTLYHSPVSPLHKAHEEDLQTGRFLEHARIRVTSRRLLNSDLRLPTCPAATNEGEIFIVQFFVALHLLSLSSSSFPLLLRLRLLLPFQPLLLPTP